MGEVRIGTSGWRYPAGPGTWSGIFYPPSVRSRRSSRVDELAYYAEHFDTVEVNATFYRPPDPGVTRSWAERTPPRFDFSLKLYQKFTHPAMYARGTRAVAPADGDAIPRATRVDADGFLRAIEPLAEAGKLGPVLAQFPPSFRHTPDARGYLDWLLGAFRGHPMAVELRHRSWSDEAAETLALLGEHGAAWVQIDEPKFRFSIRQDHLPNLSVLYYMRLHGRNAEKWWTHDHPDERYNYLYTPGELEGFADVVNTVRQIVRRLYVYLNNHFAAKAVANAALLRHRVGQEVPGTYPAEMVRRYPFLEPLVAIEGSSSDSLFGGEGRADVPAEDAESQEG
ncbi:MAG: DUF72 domain-containing protein [Acidobacteriota bacterium]